MARLKTDDTTECRYCQIGLLAAQMKIALHAKDVGGARIQLQGVVQQTLSFFPVPLLQGTSGQADQGLDPVRFQLLAYEEFLLGFGHAGVGEKTMGQEQMGFKVLRRTPQYLLKVGGGILIAAAQMGYRIKPILSALQVDFQSIRFNQ